MTLQPASDILSRAIDLLSAIVGRQRTPARDIPRIDSAAFKVYSDYFDSQVSDLVDQLANKQITLDQWETAMQKEIEALHTTDYILGVGGLDNMTQEDLDKIQEITDKQVGFLHKWADQLRADMDAGKEINYTGLKSRAKLYRNAADATLQQAVVAHMGLPPIPVPRDGSTQCKVSCLCSWRIDRLEGDGNFDCFWVLGQPETEHCDTCPNRAVAWNPLRIRGGIIENLNGAGLFHND